MPVLDGRMRGIRSIRERDFYSGESGAGPIRPFAAINRWFNRRTRRLSMLSINADPQTPRAGSVMTGQIEAVDFFAFDNSYARLPDRFFAT
jgi:hypothetical protein